MRLGRMTAAIRATANPLTQNGTKARHATGRSMLPWPFLEQGSLAAPSGKTAQQACTRSWR